MPKTTNICIWGDSITYGAWDTEGGWADRLRRFLHDRTISSKFSEYFWVYNLGIPGETSRDILARFDGECTPRKPQIIIFGVGVNDSAKRINENDRPSCVPIDEFEKNITTLLDKAVVAGAQPIFMSLVYVDDEGAQRFEASDNISFAHEEMLAYNAVLERVCAARNVPVIDVLNLLSNEDLIDGLHPNASGNFKIFEAVRDSLTAQGVL